MMPIHVETLLGYDSGMSKHSYKLKISVDFLLSITTADLLNHHRILHLHRLDRNMAVYMFPQTMDMIPVFRGMSNVKQKECSRGANIVSG
jgi:hypothetical protein